jgi:hypothetical protein
MLPDLTGHGDNAIYRDMLILQNDNKASALLI